MLIDPVQDPTVQWGFLVTNACESFHSQLNAAFGRRHPTVFKVIEVVKDIALWVLGHLGEKKLDFTWEVKIYWQ